MNNRFLTLISSQQINHFEHQGEFVSSLPLDWSLTSLTPFAVCLPFSFCTLDIDHSTWQPFKHRRPEICWMLSIPNASPSSNTSAHSVHSASIPNPAPTGPSAHSSVSALCALSRHSSLPLTVLTILQVLCAFRTKREYCDGHHDVAPICEQFLTDKGCKYRKESDHPWLARSHDVELRRCMDVMLKPHRLGLYGVQHY